MFHLQTFLSFLTLGITVNSQTVPINTWPDQSFKSVTFAPPTFSVAKSNATLAPGLIFITPADVFGSGAQIMTEDGELVWNAPTAGAFSNLNVATLDSKPILTYWNGSGSANVAAQGHGYGYVSILDETYTEIHRICPDLGLNTLGIIYPCQADLHESYVTERGSLLVSAYNITIADLTPMGGPKEGYVYDGMFFEIDIKTQEILFSWSALEAGIPVNDTRLRVPFNNSTNFGTAANPLDWFHINSVQSVGDGYLVNSRHLFTSFMVDSKGAVDWKLSGDTGGDFTLDPNGQFSWQHHVRMTNVTSTSGILTMFNNYNSLPPLNGTHPTEGLVFNLDLTDKTATLLNSFHDPSQELYVDTQGAFSVLPNGNAFMGYGQIPVMKEYGPDGDVRMTIQFGDLTAAQSYRNYRSEWGGTPTKAPDVAVQNGVIYMSWNGATGVSDWVVYGGNSSETSALVEMGKINKAGFETSFNITGGMSFFKVAAFSGSMMLRESAIMSVA
ncbi:ASST-domain-containing protein [Tricladium varicosporioides]|nr:ASST-domain-containing protein [Hymenoscyphus varicosporioides]